MRKDRRTFEPVERDRLLLSIVSEMLRDCVRHSRECHRLGLMDQRDYYAIRNISFRDLRRRKRTQ